MKFKYHNRLLFEELMMPTKLRKIRKARGSRTIGWGTEGQHRGSGMRGGYGKSGWDKHNWTYTVKYAKDKIGKKGFKCPTSREKLDVINLKQLDELAAKSDVKEGEKMKIDLTKLKVNKLLGEGIATRSYIINVQNCSKKAKKKIENAGGKVEVKS